MDDVNRILIVRMSALGDIVHALPVLAALGDAFPSADIDWLADAKYAGILDLVDGVSRCIIGRPGLSRAIRQLRQRRYDVAIDLQGLLKSASMARLSGASRVMGFERAALREPAASWFYTDAIAVPQSAHIVQKNLAVLALLGIEQGPVRFPFRIPASPVADEIVARAEQSGDGLFVVLNPGAAWPNKRWAPARFGQLASRIRETSGLTSVVLWGRGEEALADAVVAASGGAASRAPETSLADLLAIARRAALMIAGDTGPLHIAAAVGTPIVGIYGPTWPERNGPWDPADRVVSRAASCVCHHKRRCQRARMCLDDVSVDEVFRATQERLAQVLRT